MDSFLQHSHFYESDNDVQPACDTGPGAEPDTVCADASGASGAAPRYTYARTHPMEEPLEDSRALMDMDDDPGSPVSPSLQCFLDDDESFVKQQPLPPIHQPSQKRSQDKRTDYSHRAEERAPIQNMSRLKGTKKLVKYNEQCEKDINYRYREEVSNKRRALAGHIRARKDNTVGEKWVQDRYNRVMGIIKYVKDSCSDLNVTYGMVKEVEVMCSKALDGLRQLSYSEKEKIIKKLTSPNFWAFALLQEAWARNTGGWEVSQESSMVGEECAEICAQESADSISWEHLSVINDDIAGKEYTSEEKKYGKEGMFTCKRAIPKHSIKGDSTKTSDKFKTLDDLLLKGGDLLGIRGSIIEGMPPQLYRYNEPSPRDDSVMMQSDAKKLAISKSIYAMGSNEGTSYAHMASRVNRV